MKLLSQSLSFRHAARRFPSEHVTYLQLRCAILVEWSLWAGFKSMSINKSAASPDPSSLSPLVSPKSVGTHRMRSITTQPAESAYLKEMFKKNIFYWDVWKVKSDSFFEILYGREGPLVFDAFGDFLHGFSTGNPFDVLAIDPEAHNKQDIWTLDQVYSEMFARPEAKIPRFYGLTEPQLNDLTTKLFAWADKDKDEGLNAEEFDNFMKVCDKNANRPEVSLHFVTKIRQECGNKSFPQVDNSTLWFKVGVLATFHAECSKASKEASLMELSSFEQKVSLEIVVGAFKGIQESPKSGLLQSVRLLEQILVGFVNM